MLRRRRPSVIWPHLKQCLERHSRQNLAISRFQEGYGREVTVGIGLHQPLEITIINIPGTFSASTCVRYGTTPSGMSNLPCRLSLHFQQTRWEPAHNKARWDSVQIISPPITGVGTSQ